MDHSSMTVFWTLFSLGRDIILLPAKPGRYQTTSYKGIAPEIHEGTAHLLKGKCYEVLSEKG
ncbi:MAG: hypothetical protein A4E63_02400 [Syntrophorhabdus sp. PtaU1.Bin050]|nr:MAG: hypothetical protein A4E63_02400 [Syntrophorhabdus sp. PtaU1.Bin050]